MSQNDAIPPRAAEGVLDPGTLRQLLDLDDGELGLIQEMCQLFAEDMPPRILAMEAAIKAGQREEMGDVAHAVKGAASTMGAPRVRAVALALETLGRLGQSEESAEALLERLKVEYTAAQEALQAFIVSKGGVA
jgi:HPt (histidine-containing phosphotransfer) domain-containing protein